MRLKEKVVFITGAGSGLGREATLLFAREGASVAVTDVLPDRAAAVVAEVIAAGGDAFAHEVDVRVEEQVACGVDATVERYGQLDVMFANAGVRVSGPRGLGTSYTPLDEVTLESWREVQDTNLLGVFLSCKHAVRVMKPRRRGAIIATSSAASLVGYPGMAIYSASKGGINGLVKSLSLEVGPWGIKVNAICPTHGMSANFLMAPDAPVAGQSYEQMAGEWNSAISPIPLKLDRPPTILDNAYAALFLASDESAYMSGLCLPTTDGGTLSRVAMLFESNWLEQVTFDDPPSE